MNLIVLYGPPGSGKYTLGKKLSEYYSYGFLHNHAIFDLTNAALDKTTDSYWTFCWKLRKEVILEGINEKISGMVMTRAGIGSESELKFFSDIKKYFEKSDGSLIIIKLSCSMDTLKNRVQEESRKKFTKVQDVEDLERWFTRYQDKQITKNEFIIDNNRDIEQTFVEITSLLNKKIETNGLKGKFP